MVKRIFLLLIFLMMPLAMADNIQVNIYSSGSGNNSSYRDYAYYQNPPRQSLITNGYSVMLNSKVRYIHSPSKLKGAKQAARIDYYNSMYY